MFSFFHRLKVSQKLMLISVLFMIPDSVLLCLFLFSINSNIQFARWEKYGNEYQRPLEDLLEEIPEHYLLTKAAVTNSAEIAPRLAVKETRIENAILALEKVDAELGEKLQFTDEGLAKRKREHFRAGIFKEEWKKLKSEWSHLNSEELLNRHQHLVTDLRTMITHVGDNSNLILDPDLDSYYLMDVTLLALPEMQERLATVMVHGEAALSRGEISVPEQRHLAVFGALLREADLDRVLGSTRTALNEDQNFYETSPSLQRTVPPALEEFAAKAEAFIKLLDRLSNETKPDVSPAAFLAAGSDVREASFKLWRVADSELDVLLQKRVDYFRYRRARSLILTGLALGAAIGFVTFITRSISGPLTRQAAQLKQSNQALQGQIAERERVEAALRSAEEKYRSIFENAVEGIFQTTVDGHYLVANQTLARVYGYDSVADLQANITDIGARLYVEPTRRAEFRRLIEEHGMVHQFESEIYRKDGSKVWISEHARAVRDVDGKLLYYEGTVEDITERKRNELELKRVHKELVEASRMAGMAEVATGVLHNVGNVLTSMNIATTEVREQIDKSRLGHLRKAIDLMGQHREELPRFLTEDSKGKVLPGFLEKLTSHLEEEKQGLRKEMEAVASHIEHIKQIVTMQQSYARSFGAMELLQPSNLVEGAIKLAGDSLRRHAIEVEKDFVSDRTVLADRHKVMQILVNLIRNATQAIKEANPAQRKLQLSLFEKDGSKVCISVKDTGVGISPENFTRIFQHGFTTKSTGHGFGLHSSVLSAREMKGDLTVYSAGQGLGATFTLELPAPAST